MTDERYRHIAVAAGAGIIATGVLVFAVGHWNTLYDDAFIYFRYVRNLHDGCGLAFNCGEAPVEGFTGPLYLFALWVASLFTDRIAMACQVLGCASMIAAGLFVANAAMRLGRDLKTGAALVIAVAIALGLDPLFQLNTVIGMETAMAIAAFTLVGWAAITERPRLLVVAVCAAWLVRPEGLVFVFALPILPMMRRVRLLAAAVGFVVAVTAIRYAIFDAFLPNTYAAKSGGTARHAALGLAYIGDAIVDFPLAFLAPLALLGTRRRVAIFVLAPTAVWLGFFLRSGGDLFDYSRLVVPLVPVLSALALVGALELADRVVAIRRHAVVVPLALGLVTGMRAAIAHAIPDQGMSPRVIEWAETGLYLRDHFPGATVATVPIGAIGYYSKLPIIDLVGLTDATIAREGRSVPTELLTKRWIGHERSYTEYVLARAPDVIVTTEHRDHPWITLAEARAGFYADWQLLREIKAGHAPYHVHDAEVMPGDHMLMLVRDQ